MLHISPQAFIRFEISNHPLALLDHSSEHFTRLEMSQFVSYIIWNRSSEEKNEVLEKYMCDFAVV